jgi:membrane associated rhomboid family serine protease
MPYVNLTIIALNIIMFVVQMVLGVPFPNNMGDSFTNGWALIPAEITTGQDITGPQQIAGVGTLVLTDAPLGSPYLTLLTSMFMHGGLLHIASNMLFLFIFGDNVEDNMGHIKYLVFYLLSGFAASFAQIFLGGTDSIIPNVGASGAIAGVLGAYLILFPGARIKTLIPLGPVITVGAVPAIVMIGVWIATQVLSVFLQEQTTGGGVAFWAHIGGFVAGLLLTFLLRGRETGSASPGYAR